MRKLAIYGATGTIGDNALALVDAHSDKFEITVLTAHSNIEKLATLAHNYKPMLVVVGQGKCSEFQTLAPDYKGEILEGEEGLLEASRAKTDMALMAIVGFAALPPTIELIKQNTSLALANKECLVVAGALIMQLAETYNTLILPVDSEHNALFQLLEDKPNDSIEKVVITASGGPFRALSHSQMKDVTPEQAVAHPNWRMGAKISVDSATLMNKGLELIEAHHFFRLSVEQLDVLVHPQSVVHALVYFRDGAVLAQKSLPDMRIPLASVLAYPERLANQAPALDLAKIGTLEFASADRVQFPCLRLAEQALAAGGLAPTVLNAANEVAVEGFLTGKIGFLDIEAMVATALSAPAQYKAEQGLEAIIACDIATRQFCVDRL